MKTSDLLKWTMHHNFRCLTAYLKYGQDKLQTDIEDLQRDIDKAETEGKEIDHKVAKGYVEGYFSDCLRRSVLLMAYALFEEYLVHVCRKQGNRLSSTPFEQRDRYGLDAFKTFLSPMVKGTDLFSGQNWCRIKDAAKVRHLLIHCSGNLSLAKERTTIEQVIKRHDPNLCVENKHALRVRDGFVEVFVQSSIGFLEHVMDLLDARIDATAE